jgi:hypothetical protein
MMTFPFLFGHFLRYSPTVFQPPFIYPAIQSRVLSCGVQSSVHGFACLCMPLGNVGEGVRCRRHYRVKRTGIRLAPSLTDPQREDGDLENRRICFRQNPCNRVV